MAALRWLGLPGGVDGGRGGGGAAVTAEDTVKEAEEAGEAGEANEAEDVVGDSVSGQRQCRNLSNMSLNPSAIRIEHHHQTLVTHSKMSNPSNSYNVSRKPRASR